MSDEKLRQGIAAFRAGNKVSAGNILSELVAADPTNESAWLWLSACLDNIEQKKTCLSRALAINPDNESARKALIQLEQPPLPSLEEIVSPSVTAPSPRATGITLPPPPPTEWVYKDFVYEFAPPGQGFWAKLGSGAYSEAGARLEFWQNSQAEITSELQKWLDDGWQPIGEIGPSCIEIKTSLSHRDKSTAYWLIMLFFSVPTAGLVFLIALLARSNIAEPIQFTVKLRAPEGTKAPYPVAIPNAAVAPKTANETALEREQNELDQKAGRGCVISYLVVAGLLLLLVIGLGIQDSVAFVGALVLPAFFSLGFAFWRRSRIPRKS